MKEAISTSIVSVLMVLVASIVVGRLSRQESRAASPGSAAAATAQGAATNASVQGDTPVDRGKVSIFVLDELIRESKDPNASKRPRQPAAASEREKWKSLLERARGKDRRGEPLSFDEQYDAAVAVFGLLRSGEQVTDAPRWINDAFFTTLNGKLESSAAALKVEEQALLAKFQKFRDDAALLIQEANRDWDNGDLDRAIKYYDNYVQISEKLIPAGRSPDDDEGIRAVKTKLGLTYIDRSNRYERDGKPEPAREDRAKALLIWDELRKRISGSSLDILPGDEKSKTYSRWFLRITTGKARAEVRTDGIPHFWMHDESSSFSFTRLISRDHVDDYCLHWQWKLDKRPPGALKAGVSVNHPLGVVAVFLRDPKLLEAEGAKYHDRAVAALHYVWETTPGKKKGDEWIDPDIDVIQLGPFKYTTIYPHIVAATTEEPLERWLQGEADIAADYRHFFNEEPPSIRAVIVHTNCQYGPPGQVYVAEGSVGGLEFVKKIAGKCPASKP